MVMAVTGLSYRQVDYQMTQAGVGRVGTGNRRRFAYIEVVRFGVLKALTDAGLQLLVANQAAATITEDEDTDFTGVCLCSRDGEWTLSRSSVERPNEDDDGEVMVWVDVGRIQTRLDAAIEDHQQGSDPRLF